jgi:hypothetical protein
MMTLHGPEPVQASLQPVNSEPGVVYGCRLTEVL